jgi:hypothetical protein
MRQQCLRKVFSFRFDQQFFCTDDRGDDLDGPGQGGDGLRSERDPDEFQHPAMGPPGSPCIVGATESGSLPRSIRPASPRSRREKVWAILPFFDSMEDPDATLEVVEAPFPTEPAADVQCPELGPPLTEHKGTLRHLHDSGGCPARPRGGKPCLTSLASLRVA